MYSSSLCAHTTTDINGRFIYFLSFCFYSPIIYCGFRKTFINVSNTFPGENVEDIGAILAFIWFF